MKQEKSSSQGSKSSSQSVAFWVILAGMITLMILGRMFGVVGGG